MRLKVNIDGFDAKLFEYKNKSARYVLDQKYEHDRNLVAAAETAIFLGKPLLLTGEPGIGKSEFAAWMASQSKKCRYFRYIVKSDTRGSDLFYKFDQLARFHDANVKAGVDDPLRYIRYNALGLAVLHSVGTDEARKLGYLSDKYHKHLIKKYGSVEDQYLSEASAISVVLIDEIDKAPRDVPNDLLDEIVNYRFSVPELDKPELKAVSTARPLVVITSNSERDLPPAFLRRCIYFHMQFPSEPGKLEAIAEAKIEGLGERDKRLLGKMIRQFVALRNGGRLKNQPSVASFIDWVSYLHQSMPYEDNAQSADLFYNTARTTLLKDSDDGDIISRDYWNELLLESARKD